MSSPILSTLARSRPLWGPVCQQYRKMSGSAEKAIPLKSRKEKAAQSVFASFIKDKGPGLFITTSLSVVGFLCLREIFHVDSSITALDKRIDQSNSGLDKRIDQSNASIVLTNARIDNLGEKLGDKIDKLKDAIMEQNKIIMEQNQRKSSWW